jgi:hypothetical protein
MGFNLGRFASGVAQGGLNTYMTLSDIEQKQKELALREEAAEREKTEYERKLAVDRILKEASAPEATVGTGQSMSSVAGALPIAAKGGQYDTEQYRQAFTDALSKMTPEQQQATLRQYASATPEGVGGAPAREGGMGGVSTPARSAIDLGKAVTYKGEDGQTYVTDQARTRSQEEVGNRFVELAGKSGSSLAMEKAMDFQAKQAQAAASKQALELGSKQLVLADISIGAAKREENYRKNLDDFSNRTLKTQEILHDLPNVGLKEAPSLVNGALKDFGLTAKYIEPTGDAAKKQAIGGVQMGTVEVRDSKGKVVGNFNSVAEIQSALNGQMEQYHNRIASELVQMLPNAADRLKFMNEAQTLVNEKAKVNIMGRQADTAEKNAQTGADELKAKMDAGLFGAQAAQARGAANASNAHAALYGNMAALSKSNAEAGAVMKPYMDKFSKLTPEQQNGDEGRAVLVEAATAAAKKTGDVTGILNALTKDKVADRKASDAADWQDIEKQLYKDQTPPAQIAAARNQFYADRGYAPPAAVAALQVGRTNKGEKMTEADVDSFNAQFPQSKVDKSTLKWLNPAAQTTTTSAAATNKTTTAAPPAAIPAGSAKPEVSKSVVYGKELYTAKGVSGTFKTKQEAEQAWLANKQKTETRASSGLNFND